jgi:monofunctional biosynthetic peptidoglycan transglycosylase
MRRALAWIAHHKVRTIIAALLLFLIAELLTIPFLSIPRLAQENPAQTSLMRQRLREAAAEGRPLTITQHWIALRRIPKYVIDAVIVAEDGTFFQHGGIDWYEVQASMEKDFEKRGAVRGASTITQQLAKNLYLSTSKDPIRKIKELVITLLMEHDLTKDRILELYLNEIEWGRGIFGIDAASQFYFGTSASSLSLDEAARLAAVIPSPLLHRPDTDSRYVMRRRLIVLRRMQARNFIAQITSEDRSSKQPSEQHPDTNVVPLSADSLAFPPDTIETDTIEIEKDENHGL